MGDRLGTPGAVGFFGYKMAKKLIFLHIFFCYWVQVYDTSINFWPYPPYAWPLASDSKANDPRKKSQCFRRNNFSLDIIYNIIYNNIYKGGTQTTAIRNCTVELPTFWLIAWSAQAKCNDGDSPWKMIRYASPSGKYAVCGQWWFVARKLFSLKTTVFFYFVVKIPYPQPNSEIRKSTRNW